MDIEYTLDKNKPLVEYDIPLSINMLRITPYFYHSLNDLASTIKTIYLEYTNNMIPLQTIPNTIEKIYLSHRNLNNVQIPISVKQILIIDYYLPDNRDYCIDLNRAPMIHKLLTKLKLPVGCIVTTLENEIIDPSAKCCPRFAKFLNMRTEQILMRRTTNDIDNVDVFVRPDPSKVKYRKCADI